MKESADVTVVIPNYNGIEYVDGCLKSLYEGSKVPKVVMVDNGSTDGSVELVKKNYPMCKIVRFPENKGFCRAVNEGIRLADTAYVILLNNDTVVDKEFVRCLWKAIRKRADAFSISAKMLSLQRKGERAGSVFAAV